jgi:hypothetical protein
LTDLSMYLISSHLILFYLIFLSNSVYLSVQNDARFRNSCATKVQLLQQLRRLGSGSPSSCPFENQTLQTFKQHQTALRHWHVHGLPFVNTFAHLFILIRQFICQHLSDWLESTILAGCRSNMI